MQLARLHRSVVFLSPLSQEAGTSCCTAPLGGTACRQALSSVEKEQMEMVKFQVARKVETMQILPGVCPAPMTFLAPSGIPLLEI